MAWEIEAVVCEEPNAGGFRLDGRAWQGLIGRAIPMSYDLMVFDPEAGPQSRGEFMDWYRQQTKWREGHRYDDPAVSALALRSWFLDMITCYPMMNGPYATEEDSSRVTDYSVGRAMIYAAFAWSEAEKARETVFRLADKHRVGFFDVSNGNGAVWIHDENGQYRCVHGQGALKPDKKWWEIWRQ
jgi:hypothetical protein